MKRILSILLALMMVMSFSNVALADEPVAPDGSGVRIMAVKPGGSTRAEETAWYFRVVDGIVQMRLWSITYRKWLTEWIDVGPYIGG